MYPGEERRVRSKFLKKLRNKQTNRIKKKKKYHTAGETQEKDGHGKDFTANSHGKRSQLPERGEQPTETRLSKIKFREKILKDAGPVSKEPFRKVKME